MKRFIGKVAAAVAVCALALGMGGCSKESGGKTIKLGILYSTTLLSN